jgi:hypothetical protein
MRLGSRWLPLSFLLILPVIGSSNLWAQNPVPLVNQPLVPGAVAPGGPEFTLTVNGTGFAPGATVDWNGSPRTTSFVSGKQLTATINAADIAGAGTASVTVVNPIPGGGASNVVFLPITNATPSVTFNRTDFIAGSSPASVVVGDFTGDGTLDLVLGDYEFAPYVTVLLGDGTGKFTATTSPPNGEYPTYALAVGDFNGDGKLDLAVLENQKFVNILLGVGDGTFTAIAQPLPPEGFPISIAVGDFNGDGKLDLAVANTGVDVYGSNTVTILLGNGDGTFTATAQSPTTGNNPGSMAVGDFNGDGNLDLAVVNTCGNGPPNCPSGTPGTVTILMGDGNGGFTAAASSPATTPNPGAVAAGDFNGDGRLDLAVTFWNAPNNGVSVLLQSPDMTISKTHTGNFTVLRGDTYTITATNSGSAATNGTVTVTDTLPAGLTATAMAGAGWDCSGSSFPVVGNGSGSVSCTRSDALAAGASYPSITLTVNVGNSAVGGVTNTATVSGGGEGNTSNNTATDPTTIIIPTAGFSPASLIFPAQLVGAASAAQTVTLTNGGNTTLNIFGYTTSGDFAQTNTCGSSVAAGQIAPSV